MHDITVQQKQCWQLYLPFLVTLVPLLGDVLKVHCKNLFLCLVHFLLPDHPRIWTLRAVFDKSLIVNLVCFLSDLDHLIRFRFWVRFWVWCIETRNWKYYLRKSYLRKKCVYTVYRRFVYWLMSIYCYTDCDSQCSQGYYKMYKKNQVKYNLNMK